MATIDADAHVLEQPKTWSYMRDFEQQYVPMIVTPVDGPEQFGPQGNLQTEFWVVDGKIHSKQANMGLDTTAEAREMRDIQKRLDHMDELKVDVQVLYPTLFLRPYTHKLEAELALCRSYNRWLAEIWTAAPERLRWAVCPPLMSPMETIREELEFGKANGACGVFMRGLECDRTLADPYFHPLYAAASDLDMPITMHSGTSNAQFHDFFELDPGFNKFKLTMVGAFHSLIWNETPSKFPDLRWAFIECSSQWVPYAMNDLQIRFRQRNRKFADDLLADNNIYIAVQVTDDLDYVASNVNTDYLVCGTDYGHYDTSTEIEAMRKVRDDGKLANGVVDRILDDNPRRLYGLN